MKRLYLLVATLLLGMTLSACGGITPTPTSTPAPTSTSTSTPAATATATAISTSTSTSTAIVNSTPTSMPSATATVVATATPTVISAATSTATASVGGGGCGGSGTPAITYAAVGTGYDSTSHQATGTSGPFHNGDVLHAVIHVEPAPLGTEVRLVWTLVSDQSGLPVNLVFHDTQYKASGDCVNDFVQNPDWKSGDYKLEIYINNILMETLNFSIP